MKTRLCVCFFLSLLVGCASDKASRSPEALTLNPRAAVSVGGETRSGGAVITPVSQQGEILEIPYWEYRVLSMSRDLAGQTQIGVGDIPPESFSQNVEGALNQWGNEGWELCHVEGDVVILKRPR